MKIRNSSMLKCVNIVFAIFLTLILKPSINPLFAAEKPTAYFIDSLTRISPDDTPLTNTTISIYAAKNEYEPYQIVISGGSGGLKNITMSASPLKSKNGATIDSKFITLYREHYLEIKTNSPKSSLKPGWYPDALIPLINPYTGEPLKGGRFSAMPFDVEPMKNQPIWVEVYVPPDASSGVYEGVITISPLNLKLNYTLTVWNFKLPDKPSLRSNFGSFGSRIAKSHKAEPNTDLYRLLEYRYSEALAQHRLSPLIPSYLMPQVKSDGSIAIDDKTINELKKWMNEFHITGFPLRLIGSDPTGKDRERSTRYLRQMYDFLKSNGWEKLAYIYVLDEPNDVEAYEQVRKRAKLIHEAQPGIKVLCTEQPTPQKPEWGTLVGSVDIWVPLWPLFEEKPIAERLAAGEEVWSYTALCQGEKGKDTPFWQIDFPLLNYRVPSWISYRYGLHGILYWTTVYWEQAKDVWTIPATYRNYNGEGSLFYPGIEVGLDGPVASMRLKQIREGIEDFEYLQLLSESGNSSKAQQLVREVARSWTDWEKDAKKLYNIRMQIGNLLSK